MKKLLPLIIISIGVGFFCITYESGESSYIRVFKNEEYFGSIIQKFLDSNEKMQPRIIINDGTKHAIQNPIYYTLTIGDTIYKQKDNLKYFLIRNGDTTVFYQQYGNKDVTN